MDQREVDLKELSKIIWKWRSKIILYVFIITTLSIGVSLLLPKWYKAKAVVLAPESSGSSLNPMSILGDLGLGPMTGGNEN
ncbi:MAG: Wzz/FepE/Etk N-terminal domain-containing protein, partial [Candidatus Neomarinimicrobiota bacterium]